MEPSQDLPEVGQELMTLGQAAAWLGWRGRDRARRLKRRLKAVEKRLGREIMVRGGKYMVTKGAILRWAPDLRPPADDLSRSFRSHLRKIDQRIDKRIQAAMSDTVEAQISKLWEFLAQVTESINKLNERLVAIGGQNRP
jgi:polyhydroxyalkanoate synthesis regulator phasin